MLLHRNEQNFQYFCRGPEKGMYIWLTLLQTHCKNKPLVFTSYIFKHTWYNAWKDLNNSKNISSTMASANSRLTIMIDFYQPSGNFLTSLSWEMNQLVPNSIVKSKAFQSTRPERTFGPWLIFLESLKIWILTLLLNEFIA